MKFKKSFFKNYLKHAPLPLAIERSMECEILSRNEFSRPILDIGCGDGIFAHNLFAEKIDLGIDPNLKEIESAKKFDIYEKLIPCYGDNIPLPSNSFNTIFSNSVMEHIKEIDKVLIEAHRLLTPNGVMYLTLPTDFFEKHTLIYNFLNILKQNKLAEKYSKWFNKFWRHHHAYNCNSWIELFNKCGFEVVKMQEYGQKSVCTLNDCLSAFSLMPFITKKIFNKWFFIPIRAITAPIIYKIYHKISRKVEADVQGGLIFFEIRKK